MDIEVFTKERLKFARFFYSESIKPFKVIIEQIEKQQTPYIPEYDESGDPQFIYEWIQASDGIDAVGMASLSMLSSALQLYMNGWLDRVEARVNVQKAKRKGKNGWFHALKAAIESHGVSFSNCSVDISILEQMVLARNRIQHSENITSNAVVHISTDLKKFKSHVFVNPNDVFKINSGFDWVYVYIDERIFNDVTNAVEKFCNWLETRYKNRIRRKKRDIKRLQGLSYTVRCY